MFRHPLVTTGWGMGWGALIGNSYSLKNAVGDTPKWA